MSIKQTSTFLPVVSLCLLLAGGCASKGAVVKDPPPAPVNEPAKADTVKPGAVTPLPPVKPATGKVVNTIAAIVNDEIITLYEVESEARPVIREAEKKTALDDAAKSKIRRTALERLIEKKLLDQKARELNVRVSDEELRQAIEDVKKQNNITSQQVFVSALASQGLTYEQYRSQLREQIEKLKLVSIEVRSKIHVSESEMRAYYDANQAKYSQEETFRARHIFFKVNEKMSPDEIKRTMATALKVLADARSGKDFAELARVYSEDPAARKDGGDLGSFKKGDMLPELEAAILPMKPGSVSELVYTPTGFHIILLEERNPGKAKPFESVRAEIEDAIYRTKSEERFNQWAKELRGRASVEVKDLNGLI